MGKDTLKLLEEVLKEKSVNEVSEILNLSHLVHEFVIESERHFVLLGMW